MTDKRVPREPTRAMIEAGNAQPYNTNRGWIWRAMYDAAPAVPDEPVPLSEWQQLVAERDALKAALRTVAIVTEDDLGYIHTLTCNLCTRTWDANGPEKHAPSCLAASWRERRLQRA